VLRRKGDEVSSDYIKLTQQKKNKRVSPVTATTVTVRLKDSHSN